MRAGSQLWLALCAAMLLLIVDRAAAAATASPADPVNPFAAEVEQENTLAASSTRLTHLDAPRLTPTSGLVGGAVAEPSAADAETVDRAFNLQREAAANRDVDEVFDGECPLSDGTVRDLKVAGNRLLYESRYMDAYDCFKRALHQWFRPSKAPSAAAVDRAKQSLAANPTRFKQLFPNTAHLTDDDLATPDGLTRLLRQRNRKLFAFRGAEYNPTFPDGGSASGRRGGGAGALSAEEEEFDDVDERELDAAKLKLFD